MSKTAIGTAMIEVLAEYGQEANVDVRSVMWGDAHFLHEAFRRSGSKAKIRHPLQAWQVVLNALDRDERFEKGYVELDTFTNNQHRLVRAFFLPGKARREPRQ